MINDLWKIKQDLLVVYQVLLLQYIMIRTQSYRFVKQDFACKNDPWFSNEDLL